MQLTQKIRTCWWLWGLLSTLLFIGIGFIDLAPGVNKGAGFGYWLAWQQVLVNNAPLIKNIVGMTALTVLFMIPCFVLGWVFHCFILLAWEAFRSLAKDSIKR